MSKKPSLTRRDAHQGRSCDGPDPAGQPGLLPGRCRAVRRDRVILGTTQEPVQFNPLLYVNGGTENDPRGMHVRCALGRQRQGRIHPEPRRRVPTRENGDISADGRTWRINLKRDVKWSDGQPFTSRDVEFTYQTISNPKSGRALAQRLRSDRNASARSTTIPSSSC